MRLTYRLMLAILSGLLCETARAADDWGLKSGPAQIKSAGPLTFGPDGVLFVGDSAGAAIFAIKTKDEAGDAAKANPSMAGLSAEVAKLFGVKEGEVKVNDLAVSHESGAVYLSLAIGPTAEAALAKIDAEGKLAKVDLDDVPHSRVEIADAPDSAAGRRGDPRDDAITDLVYQSGKLLVAGLAKGQAPSTVREFEFPFGDGATATSIEIYHAAHGRVEDGAVIRTFVPLLIDGEPTLLAGFTCTPLVRLPLKALEPGQKVRGTTVAELGNRNRPLDMIVYEKDGLSHLLLANSARGVMKVSLTGVQTNAGLNEPVKNGAAAGQPYETIKDLQGVEQLALLNPTHAVILTRSGDTTELKTIDLP